MTNQRHNLELNLMSKTYADTLCYKRHNQSEYCFTHNHYSSYSEANVNDDYSLTLRVPLVQLDLPSLRYMPNASKSHDDNRAC